MSKLCSATGADAKELVLSEYCITCALRDQQKVFSYPIQTALKTPKPSWEPTSDTPLASNPNFDNNRDKGSSEDHNKWKGEVLWELADCGGYNKDHAWVEEMTSAEHQEAMKSNWWIREQKENVFFRQSWPTIIKEQPQDPRWDSLMATGDLIKSHVTVAVFMCSRVSIELIRCNL